MKTWQAALVLFVAIGVVGFGSQCIGRREALELERAAFDRGRIEGEARGRAEGLHVAEPLPFELQRGFVLVEDLTACRAQLERAGRSARSSRARWERAACDRCAAEWYQLGRGDWGGREWRAYLNGGR